MKKRVLLYCWAITALLLISSCTVLEERSGCPCYLTMDLTKIDKGIREWQLWLFTPEGEIMFKDTIYRRAYSTPYTVQVPRNRQMQCLLWGNARGATLLDETMTPATSLLKKEDVLADSLYFFADTVDTWKEDGWVSVEPKKECVLADSLYFFSETVDTWKEDGWVRVEPRKEFATVDIYMQGWVDIEYVVELILRCDTKGFYVNGEFYPGNVDTHMQFHNLGNYYSHFRGRILRQPDTENIRLSMLLKKKEIDGTVGEIIVDKDIPIGKYLEENGYDMNKLVLEDIRMDIDYSNNNFMIKAEDWEATYKLVEEM
mgnify:CR=1 FL=1